MRLTIFGASGRTGRQLLTQALAAGHTVTAVARDPARLPLRHQRLKVLVADVLDPAAITPAVAGADDTFYLLQVRAGATLSRSPPVPDRLVRHEQFDQADAARTRRFDLDDDSAINGKPMDMGRIDQTVPQDTTEVWEVTNRSGNLHTFHVHGVQFKVVEQAGAPTPTLAGWKDSVFVPPDSTTRLLVRFTGYADPAVPYMFHCHLLEHEDNGMMGQFVVVQPG